MGAHLQISVITVVRLGSETLNAQLQFDELLRLNLQRTSIPISFFYRPNAPSPDSFLEVVSHLSRPETMLYGMPKVGCLVTSTYRVREAKPLVRRSSGVDSFISPFKVVAEEQPQTAASGFPTGSNC